jgi:hypothetical protein
LVQLHLPSLNRGAWKIPVSNHIITTFVMLMNTLKISAIAFGATTAVLASTGSAFAFSFSVGGVAAGADGYKSNQAGAVTVDFNNGVAPTSGFVSYSGINGNIVKGSRSGQHATPFSNTTNFMTISPKNSGKVGATGTVTLNFAKAIDYFGLYWGSVDTHNKINFYSAGKLVKAFAGSDISKTATGSWTGASDNLFVNFFSGTNQTFDKVELVAGGVAFESDNHTYRQAAAVPEPFTMGGMALAGMGLNYARRRKAKAAA